MKRPKNISILIPDGESAFLMSVVNCLSQTKGIKIYVMTNDLGMSMKYSKYIFKTFFLKRTDYKEQWIKSINDIAFDYNIDLIMPIDEIGIRAIIKHKKSIKDRTKLALLPSLANFDKAINKGSLVDLLKINNIPHPESAIVNPDNFESIKLPDFPLIVKPIETTGNGSGISVHYSNDTLESFFKSYQFDGDYLVQRYINGYDIDCSVLCKEGKILSFTIQKGIMYGDTKFCPQVGQEFVDNPKLLNTVKQLVKKTNWSGIAHIDMRYDNNEDDFKIIEVNPRFWQSLLASLYANVNFPFLHCLASLNLDLPEVSSNYIKFYSVRGLVKKVRNNLFFVFKFKFIWKNTSFKFVLFDPLPVLHRIYRSVRSLFEHIHPRNIRHSVFGSRSKFSFIYVGRFFNRFIQGEY